MLTILNNEKTLFKNDKAKEIADALNSDPEDEYTYVVHAKETGYSFINVFDENGNLIGHF